MCDPPPATDPPADPPAEEPTAEEAPKKHKKKHRHHHRRYPCGHNRYEFMDEDALEEEIRQSMLQYNLYERMRRGRG